MHDFAFTGETEVTDVFLSLDFIEFMIAAHQNDGEMTGCVFRDFRTDDGDNFQ